MRFLSLFALTACMIGFTGCTSKSVEPIKEVGCTVQKSITGAAAAALGTSLSCAHVDVIQADIDVALGKISLCAETAKPAASGALGDVICPMAVNGILGIGLAKIPAAWGCTGGATVDQIKKTLTDACAKAVPL